MKTNQLPSIDAATFFSHLNKLYTLWDSHSKKEFGSLLVINPKEDGANIKSMAVIGWLLGFSLNETALLFTPKELVVFASEKKINLLSTLKEHPSANNRSLVFLKKEKTGTDNTDSYQRIAKMIASQANSKVGVLIKDKKGESEPESLESYLKAKSIDCVDASQLINECFMIKDKDELDNMRRASRVTTYFLEKLIDEVKRVVDEDLTVPHSKICKKIEDMFDSQSLEMRKIESKLSKYEIKKEFVDIGSSAVVQSGGSYHLKLLGNPNDDVLKPDCIVAGFCCQYRLYNACVYRTLLINPTSQQQKNYEKVLGLNKLLINNVKPGTKLSALYNMGAQYLRSELPDFEVPNNFGYGIGLQYKESSLIINDKNDKAFEPGMTFLLVCGFKDIKDSKLGDKKYALVLTDVVIVTKDGAEVTTNDAEKKLDDINFAIQIDEDKQKKKEKKERPETNLPQRRRRQARVERDGVKLQSLHQRNAHQKYLKEQKLQELKNRLDENFSTDNKKVKQIPYQKVECYKSKQDMPKDLQPGRIYVDNKANAVIFPINGVHVPFHINVLKSVVKIDENKLTALRFNFNMPIGGVVGNIRIPPIKENTLYIKELIYRMENVKGEPEVFRQVKELQKKMKTAADEQRNKQDMVDQAKLILNKNKRPLLRDLQARPYHVKKVKGILECHVNGFRYTPNANKGQTIDIIFSNIKNAFFQPCEKEIFAALHFRLHEPIMIGKKKAEDVQFYSEVGALIEDVERRGRNDEDSDEEMRERQARRKLDKQFQAFIKSCEQAIPAQEKFQFQVPRREYAFDGAPFKVKSLLQPTKTCLMNVTDMPFFVMQLDEIEVACFERMYANIRNFDLTFIYKDFEKFIRVLSIPIEQVEKIKDWLDRSNIIFYDLQINVKWSKFMQNIRTNFKQFVEDGGWAAWDSDEEQKIQRDEQQGDSEYSAVQQQEQSQEISSEGYSEQYDEQDDDSGQYEDEDELSEPGLDEEELSRHMEEMDRKKIRKQFEAKKVDNKKKK